MKNILIIEDEEILLSILRIKFTEHGWQVDTASDGEDALKKIKQKKYDLLLLDLLLPKVDGFGVIERIKKDKLNGNFPIIVMSNLGDDDSIEKALSMGADEYFIKNQHPLQNIIERAERLAGGRE